MEEEVFFEPRSWVLTLLLCLFLGWFGIHRFYVRKTGTGLLMILLYFISTATALLGLVLGTIKWIVIGYAGYAILGLLILFDLIMIVMWKFKDSQGRSLV